MLKLNEISESTLDWYYKLIIKKIDTSLLSSKAQEFLTDDMLKSILTEKPEILLDIHISSNCELKDKSIVEKVFDYKKIISNSDSISYEIAKKVGVNTCTYCNRNYTFTIVYLDEKTGNENTKTRIARPQFDHWFSQKDYPLLALSIYNLIPCCSTCNSSIKSSKELKIKEHIHPYIEETNSSEKGFKFSYKLNELSKPSVWIKYEKDNSKINKTLDFFKTEKVYDAHSEFELKDLIDLANKYPKNYLKDLFDLDYGIFKELNMSKEEIYRMIFGIETKEEEYHKRPFSKFKHDIIEELKNIQ